ncbi:phosphopantetheine-binding protein [Pseudothauera nasutitermitis]|uniref:Phosphopantetheine-binding protein n=1 Tax=Pseudothauera nasutitermitis TaxID=2565930 RepID=A0A4S4AWY1_9RHOO|nr:phosphopantetheine-binding protein [Pseudothauera nasutitermitis]THF64524.1 phosphopantetheine-binding protein [Pseudothauera nasutitermitis]
MSTPSATSAPLTLDRIRSEIAGIIHESPEDIGLDDSLVDWGLDSLRLLNLITAWNQTGLQLDMSELAGQLTLNAIWKVIRQRQAGA